jgi:hypothetical protein
MIKCSSSIMTLIELTPRELSTELHVLPEQGFIDQIQADPETSTKKLRDRVEQMHKIWKRTQTNPDTTTTEPFVYEGVDEHERPVWVSMSTETMTFHPYRKRRRAKQVQTLVTVSLTSHSENPSIKPEKPSIDHVIMGFTVRGPNRILVPDGSAGITHYSADGASTTLTTYPPFVSLQPRRPSPPDPLGIVDRLFGYMQPLPQAKAR